MYLVALMSRKDTTIGSITMSRSFGVTLKRSNMWSHITSIASAQLLPESCATTTMVLWLWTESISTLAGVQMRRTAQSFTIRRYQSRPLWHWLNSWTNSNSQQVLKKSTDSKRKSSKSSLGSICLAVNLHLNAIPIVCVQSLPRKGHWSLKWNCIRATCLGAKRIREFLMKNGNNKVVKKVLHKGLCKLTNSEEEKGRLN